MPELHFQFNQGQHEEADARILPAGLLATAQNVRIRKDGRIVPRYGYRYDTSVTPPSNIVRCLQSTNATLLLRSNNDLVSTKIHGQIIAPATPYGPATMNGFTGVTRSPAASGLLYGMGTVDCCAFNGVSTDAAIVLAIWEDAAGAYGRVVARSFARDGSVMATNTWLNVRGPRLLSYGNAAFAILRAVGAATHALWSFSPTTLTWSSVGSLTSYSSASEATGDALCTDADTVYYLVFTGPVTAWQLRKYVVSTHTDSLVANIATLVFAPWVALGQNTAGNFIITGVNSGVVYYEEVTPAGLLVASGTVWSGSGTLAPVGPAPIVAHPTYGWLCAFTAKDATSGNANVAFVRNASSVTLISENCSIQSRPFSVTINSSQRWCVWVADANTQGTRAASEIRPTLRLLPIDIANSSQADVYSYATAMQQQAAATENGDDCRRSVGVLTAVSGSATTTARVVSQHPVYGQDASAVIWLDHGTFSAGLNAVRANGHALFAGARLWEHDGVAVFPAGLENGPCRIKAIDSGSGSGVDAGTHQYVACWKMVDASGNVHRSPPSGVASVTLSVARNVSVSMPGTRMDPIAGYNRLPSLEVYRTTAGGSVFYLCGTALPDAPSFSDTMSDATLISQAALYTQGDARGGGLSALFPNEEPPPCRFVCAGNSRLMVAGLENEFEVQWSKLFYPGEAVSWSTSAAFRRTIPEPVTAIAHLDGTWIIFTKSATYDVTGDGPDDNGASGDFGDVHRRPGDIGCISHRSVVSCAQGILFQGSNGGMWLLPRGGNAPQWIGQPIRDTLALFPVVRDACLIAAENCVYWAVCDAAGATGRLLVYDLRNGQWYVDTCNDRVIHSLTEFDGALLIDGVIPQTPGAYADAYTAVGSTVITSVVATGDIRPFGETGWGRCRMFGLLGELTTNSSLTAEISYDGAVTWPDSYAWTLTGSPCELSLQFGPKYVRATNYRIRITTAPATAGAGVALNALGLELYKAEGLKRLPAASRKG